MSVIINPTTQQATIALNANNLGVVGLPSAISESLIEIKYSFSDFNQADISSFKKGDVVVFTLSPNENSYGCKITQASTSFIANASKMLMAFVSYSGSTLVLMHKGYLDFDNISTDSNPNALQSWQIGQTIYLNNNKISITPPNASGSWVKSIGFCMPNNINKKRIWFESDSTFLTLQ